MKMEIRVCFLILWWWWGKIVEEIMCDRVGKVIGGGLGVSDGM